MSTREKQGWSDARDGYPPPQQLPDINAETHPFAHVQAILDRAALFNLYSKPMAGSAPIRYAGEVIGYQIHERLHRFHVSMGAGPGFGFRNLIGEPLATFRSRWLFATEPYQAQPGCAPPPTAMTRGTWQRFVMSEGDFTFEGGTDGFAGFGTGRTYPTEAGLIAAATGTLMQGRGRFRGLQATYTYNGILDGPRGFLGNLFLRVVDPDGVFAASETLPPPTQAESVEAGVTYFLIGGRKGDASDRTEYTFARDGLQNGLNVKQDLVSVGCDCALVNGAPRASRAYSGKIGKMGANVAFRIWDQAAPGTNAMPIPFQSYNDFTLTDSQANPLGSFDVDGGEGGRTFLLALKDLPDQQALRFGIFGAMTRGDGIFHGACGMMTDNSVVSIAPHAVSTLYVLRIIDPEGRFRPNAATGAATTTSGNTKGVYPAYAPLLTENRRRQSEYLATRKGFADHAGDLAVQIGAAFNQHDRAGSFGSFPLDREALTAAFTAGAGIYNEAAFTKYLGPAVADFRVFDPGMLLEVDQYALYSWWDPPIAVPDGRAVLITGSKEGLIRPAEVSHRDTPIDLLVNTYFPNAGVTSLTQLASGVRATAVAYDIGSATLWISRQLDADAGPTRGVHRLSLEWKHRRGGRDLYEMTGLYFDLDLTVGRARLHGNRIWKARYMAGAQS